MRDQQRQPKPALGIESFDSAVVQAAYAYHVQTADRARGNVPVEVAAFVAGACWARQVLVSDENN